MTTLIVDTLLVETNPAQRAGQNIMAGRVRPASRLLAHNSSKQAIPRPFELSLLIECTQFKNSTLLTLLAASSGGMYPTRSASRPETGAFH